MTKTRKTTTFLFGIISLSILATFSALANSQPDMHFTFDDTYDQAIGKELGKPTVNGNPEFVEGKHGKAISLREGQNLKIPIPKTLKEGEHSIAFWLKPLWHPKDGLDHPILEIPATPEGYDKAGWAAGQVLLTKGWSETIAPDFFYGVVDPGTAIKHLKPGEWTHFVVIRSEKGKYIATYVNGEGMKISLDKSPKPSFAGNVMWLGSRKDRMGAADIIIDDLKVYSRAIDSNEITEVAGEEFSKPLDTLMLANICEPNKAVETPHTKWAKPYAKGQANVICVSAGQRSREFIELAQRLSMNPIVITSHVLNGALIINEKTFERMGNEVTTALDKGNINAIIISAFGWNLFKDDVRKRILNYVANGGGLLLVDPRCVSGSPQKGIVKNYAAGLWGGWSETPEGEEIEKHVHRLDRADEEYLTSTIPLAENSMFKNELSMKTPSSLFRGGKLGKGRVLIYDIKLGQCVSQAALTPSIAYLSLFDPFDYDYAMSFAAKAVLWTAGLESDLRLEKINYGSAQEFHRDIRVGLRGEWTILVRNTTKQERQVNLDLNIHSRIGESTNINKNVKLLPGLNTVTIPYQIKRIGDIFADCVIKEDGKVLDWKTGFVKSAHGNPCFFSIKADRSSYKSDESPQITVEVALKTYGKSLGQKGNIKWRMYDPYSREIAQGNQEFLFNPYDENSQKIIFTLPDLCEVGLNFTIVVDLIRNNHVADQRILHLKRHAETPDDFVFYVWDAGASNVGTALGNIIMREKYDLTAGGITQLGRYATDGLKEKLDYVNKLDLMPWIYTTHLGGGVDKEKYRSLDWADKDVLENLKTRLHNIAQIAEPYSPLFYSLGDETKLGPKDIRATGFEQEAFTNHLKLKFQNLSKLNKQWGTDYKSWLDLSIPEPEKFYSQETSPALRNEILDFRQTMFAQLVQAGVQGATSINPKAKVGVEGVFGLSHAWGALDYAKLCPASTFLGLYALGHEADMARSFLPENALFGCWYNYGKLDKGYSQFGPWHTMLKGVNAFGWFTTFEGTSYNALNPDFSPFTQFQWTWEELSPILHGVGKLVHNLTRDNPGVYILYNFNTLERTTPYYHEMLIITRILTDMGIQHDFITGEMLTSGKAKDMKALILAGQFVMEKEVAEHVSTFVQNGGTVIATSQPAVSNGFKRYEKPLLSDIFANATPANAQKQADTSPHPNLKKVGEGATFMFGSNLEKYIRKRFDELGKKSRECLKQVFDTQHIAPAFSVNPVDNIFLPVEVICYKNARNHYVGLQRGYKTLDQETRKLTLVGPKESHVYNVRSGEYLGYKKQVVIELAPARGAMFSFLPYKADKIELTGLPPTVKAGETLNLRLQLVADSQITGKGVFRITTFNPSRKKLRPLCRKLNSSSGHAELTLQTAFNDPLGEWKMEITDIATGMTSTHKYKLVRDK